MGPSMNVKRPIGYQWRSSSALLVVVACVALFTETLLYGFVVPILPYMLEVRLGRDPVDTQTTISGLLSVHGLATLIAAPVLAAQLDKAPNGKTPFLLALTSCVVGTVLVAVTPSFWFLCLGRLMQAVAGTAAWLICLSILTEAGGDKNVGKFIGLSMSFVMMGIVGGPVIAGAMLEWRGYWAAWSVPLGILVVDIIARFIMIEKPRQGAQVSDQPVGDASGNKASESHQTGRDDVSETSALLSEPAAGAANGNAKSDDDDDQEPEPASSASFYYVVLRDGRLLTSTASIIVHSVMIAGFEATLPLYLRHRFHSGSSFVGLMFLVLQTPSVFLSPLTGWLRDRVGTRWPTVVGWVLLSPLLWLLAAPVGGHDGRATFVSAMVGIGLTMPLLSGAGFIQMMATLRSIESKNPRLFGAQGGRSRACAINSIGFNIGLMAGPLISGFLYQAIGYHYMTITLAVLCLVMAFFVFFYFDSLPASSKDDVE
ncbi:hypothetical protein HIM_10598 [Hirsutella minnesotensis 3608]|uniref:Major facilitator superfamily (MFS) profile domain-containing protein n=1 Tax=Hirsutella minnesotensis 3608 TaxID=1043627 RepID=A0A0F7ZX32_9HYPO|nr:hypothetical protein HIM_10598 [Hirsutella minnesotensis 3608]